MTDPTHTSPSGVVVWWLSQQDHELATLFGAPADWPSYIRQQFESRKGRAGRARLWIAAELGISCEFQWGASPADPRWQALGDHGGIVLRDEDARHVLAWPGVVTDLDLQPIKAPR